MSRACVAVSVCLLVGAASCATSPVARVDAVESIRIEPRSGHYVRVPSGAYALAIAGNHVVVGHQHKPVLSIVDRSSRKVETRPVPIVPRVALPVGRGGTLAIFGHEFGRGPERATQRFLLWRDGEIRAYELTEPLRVRHGLAWPDDGLLILGDQEYDSLAILEIEHLYRARPVGRTPARGGSGVRPAMLKWDPADGIPVGRIVLEAEPYHFERVSRQHLAISYISRQEIDILDLRSGEVVDRLALAGRARGRCALIAPLERPFFAVGHGDAARASLFDLDAASRRRGYAQTRWIGDVDTGMQLDVPGGCRRSPGNGLAMRGHVQPTGLWLGQGPLVSFFALDSAPARARLREPRSRVFELRDIRRIHVSPDGSEAVISSPADGRLWIGPTSGLH